MPPWIPHNSGLGLTYRFNVAVAKGRALCSSQHVTGHHLTILDKFTRPTPTEQKFCYRPTACCSFGWTLFNFMHFKNGFFQRFSVLNYCSSFSCWRVNATLDAVRVRYQLIDLARLALFIECNVNINIILTK